MCWNCIS